MGRQAKVPGRGSSQPGSCQGTSQAETLEASLLGAFGVVAGVPNTSAGVLVGMVLAVGRRPSPLGPKNRALHAIHQWALLAGHAVVPSTVGH